MQTSSNNKLNYCVWLTFGSALLLLSGCPSGDEDALPIEDGCLVDGNMVAPGASVPAPDGCNTCSCGPDGQLACTKIGCIKDPPPAQVCTYDGKTYKVGESVPSGDSCNTCGCTEQGVVCTLIGCPDLPPPPDAAKCEYNGTTYSDGDSFPSSDGCNTCSCNAGSVGCTKRACLPKPTDCVRTGCSGQLCADQAVVSTCEYRPEYACYQKATCERQKNGQCGFTPTNELVSCLGTHGNCMVGNSAYQEGDSFPSEDGCNTCSCTRGGVVCTKRACL